LRIEILAVGRSRDPAVDALTARYLERLPWRVTLREIELRGPADPERRRRMEGDRLLAAIPRDACVIVLDSRGQEVASEAFAARLEALWRQSHGLLVFVIGGAEGLDPRLRTRADWVLSLGPMTWPHLLVRAMLAEQIFRAWAILGRHPYHRC